MEVHDEFRQAWLEKKFGTSSRNGYWLGLSDLAVEGKFIWDRSQSWLYDFSAWASNEPDQSPVENCVAARPNNYMFWSDEDCNQETFYPLCQTTIGLLSCGEDEVYSEVLDLCLYEPLGWAYYQDASAYCAEFGGTLVITQNFL